MNAIDILEESKWVHPLYYGGFSPDGDYLICSKNRDSEILYNVNYDEIKKDLEKLCETLPAPEDDGNHNQGGSWVYDFRAGCSMVGWIEYLLIRADAPDQLKTMAGEILAGLANYPVYNEDKYSEEQYNTICEYWDNASLSDKISMCKDSCVSIFAARDEFMNYRVESMLLESEGFY